MLYERAVKAWPGNYASLTNWAGLLWERSTPRRRRASALASEGKIAEADELEPRGRCRLPAGGRESRSGRSRCCRHMPTHTSFARCSCDGYTRRPAGAIAEFEEVLRLMPDHPQRPVDRRSELRRAEGAPASDAWPTDSRHLSARHLLQHPRELRRAREERRAGRRRRRRTLHTHEARQPLSRAGHRLLSSRGRHLDARRVVRGLLLAAVEGIAEAAVVAASVISRRRCRRSRAASTGVVRSARSAAISRCRSSCGAWDFAARFYFVDHHTGTCRQRVSSCRRTSRPRF